MMGNNSSQSTSSHTSTNSIPLFPEFKTLPLVEGEEADWDFQEFLSIVKRRILVILVVAAAVTPAVTIFTSKGKARSAK